MMMTTSMKTAARALVDKLVAEGISDKDAVKYAFFCGSGDKVDALQEDKVDTLTIDVPAFIRALERAREDFKKDEDIHNFVQKLLAKKAKVITTADL